MKLSWWYILPGIFILAGLGVALYFILKKKPPIPWSVDPWPKECINCDPTYLMGSKERKVWCSATERCDPPIPSSVTACFCHEGGELTFPFETKNYSGISPGPVNFHGDIYTDLRLDMTLRKNGTLDLRLTGKQDVPKIILSLDNWQLYKPYDDYLIRPRPDVELSSDESYTVIYTIRIIYQIVVDGDDFIFTLGQYDREHADLRAIPI